MADKNNSINQIIEFRVEKLNKLKFDVVSVEPNISKHPFLRILDFNTAINDADIVAILVKHKEFKSPRLQKKLYDLGALDFCNSLINS